MLREMVRAALPDRCRPALFLTLAALLSAGAAPAADKKRANYLAVLPFETGQEISPETRKALEESLRTLASAYVAGYYTVLDAATQIKVLEDNGIDAANCEGNCALDTARQIQATVFLTGSMRRPGRLFRGFIRCYSAADGKVLGSVEVTGRDVDELLNDIQGHTEALFGNIPNVPKRYLPPPPESARGQNAQQHQQFQQLQLLQVESTAARSVAFKVEVTTPSLGTVHCESAVSFGEPCQLPNLPPGPATFTVGGESGFEQDITIPPGQATARLYQQDYRLSWFGGAALALGVVGVAAGAAGGAVGAMAAGGGAAAIGIGLLAYDLSRRHSGLTMYDASGRISSAQPAPGSPRDPAALAGTASAPSPSGYSASASTISAFSAALVPVSRGVAAAASLRF